MRGVIQLASVAETQTGADDTKAITPLKLAQYISSLTFIPSGTVNVFAGSTPPTGWIECDGSAISRTGVYANLFSVIGILYGSGDGISTFNIPDLRGEFIRGWDHGRSVDTGRTMGSSQSDELKSHHHAMPGTFSVSTGGGGSLFAPTGTTNTQDTGGTETRPRNIAMMYIIKI